MAGWSSSIWIHGVYRSEDAKGLGKEIVETAGRATDLVRRRLTEITREMLPPDADPDTADPAFDSVLHALDRKISDRGRF